MNLALIILQLVAAHVKAPGEIDSICSTYCQVLAVQQGQVRFIDFVPPSRNLLLGKYLPGDQHLVPKTEAPIRDLRSPQGWRVVVSAYMNHDQEAVLLRVRFFGRDGPSRGTIDAFAELESASRGTPFAGVEEICAITSN